MAHLALRRSGAGGGEAGFTLVEILISLILLLLALGLASQLLIEGQQSLVDTAAEGVDAPAPLVVARLRGDVVSASSFAVTPSASGTGVRLTLLGHPAGEVEYEQQGSVLLRRVRDTSGNLLGEGVLLHRVGSFTAAPVGGSALLFVSVRYLAHAARKSPLPTSPGARGPTTVWKSESLYLLPRGKP